MTWVAQVSERMRTDLLGMCLVICVFLSHSECLNMAKLKEELHTHGSRCVLITENVRDVERRIIENIQKDKCGQYVSLTAKQPYTKKHELTLRIGQCYATSNSTQLAEII